MRDVLSNIWSMLRQPVENPLLFSVAVGIAVVVVLIVIFLLLAIALPGRELDDEHRRHTPARRLAAIAMWAVIGLASLVAVTAISYYGTSTNTYCTRVCHEMAAPAHTWEKSSHGSVSCVRCHEGSGLSALPTTLVMRTSCWVAHIRHAPSKLFPIPESRCLECHSSMLDKKLTARNGESFTHRDIATRPGATCKRCHGSEGHVPPEHKAPSATISP